MIMHGQYAPIEIPENVVMETTWKFLEFRYGPQKPSIGD